jgi:hypothetical protein
MAQQHVDRRQLVIGLISGVIGGIVFVVLPLGLLRWAF